MDGSWIKNLAGIKQVVEEHLTNIFSSSGNMSFSELLEVVDSVVTTKMKSSLLKPISNEEVNALVFQLEPLKSLGPDGFPGIFFLNYWDIVGRDVCNDVKAFFEGKFLIKELNRTNMVLIIKCTSPKSISQFQPISLCNFIYKVIYKTMANRLKPFL